MKKSQDFLLDTVENITMAKKSCETFYDIVERNLYSTMEKLSLDEYNAIKDDFYRENVWAEHVIKQWIAFYFKHGVFPEIKLSFLKTDIPISPIDLFKKFTGSDAKALVSIQALAALNIHFRGNRYSPQQTMYEYLNNLTFQALSQENDKVYMSFKGIGLLVNDLLECFVKKENEQIFSIK